MVNKFSFSCILPPYTLPLAQLKLTIWDFVHVKCDYIGCRNMPWACIRWTILRKNEVSSPWCVAENLVRITKNKIKWSFKALSQLPAAKFAVYSQWLAGGNRKLAASMASAACFIVSSGRGAVLMGDTSSPRKNKRGPLVSNRKTYSAVAKRQHCVFATALTVYLL